MVRQREPGVGGRSGKTLQKREAPWRHYLRQFWDSPPGKWVFGLSAVAAVIVPIILAMIGGPTDSRVGTSTDTGLEAPVSSSEPPTTGCLAYAGDDERVSSSREYVDDDFIAVDCALPHQYELVERDSDTPCVDAVDQVTDRHSFSGYNRVKVVALGDYGCAFGRIDSDEMQTDTYRLSSAEDPLSAFGSCIAPTDLDAFLAGGSYVRDLPCYSGRVLGWYVAFSPEQTAEQACTEASGKIPNNGFRWQEDPVEGATPVPATRCAFFLWGVASS